MTRRKEVLNFLVNTIDNLKQQNVADLMRKGDLKKLKDIASKLDLSGLNEFIAYEPLDLEFSEIPENSYLELVFIINNSNCPDNEVFDNWWDFVDFLRNIGKNLEVHIAEAMDDDDLCDLTLNDLIR